MTHLQRIPRIISHGFIHLVFSSTSFHPLSVCLSSYLSSIPHSSVHFLRSPLRLSASPSPILLPYWSLRRSLSSFITSHFAFRISHSRHLHIASPNRLITLHRVRQFTLIRHCRRHFLLRATNHLSKILSTRGEVHTQPAPPGTCLIVHRPSPHVCPSLALLPVDVVRVKTRRTRHRSTPIQIHQDRTTILDLLHRRAVYRSSLQSHFTLCSFVLQPAPSTCPFPVVGQTEPPEVDPSRVLVESGSLSGFCSGAEWALNCVPCFGEFISLHHV